MQATSFLYAASKVAWRIAQPGNLLLLLLGVGIALLFTRWNRLGFGLVTLSTGLASCVPGSRGPSIPPNMMTPST